jgi:Cu2+-containing amine oxidase
MITRHEAKVTTMAPHPFKILSVEEVRIARDIVLSLHKDAVVDFREIYLQEPAKELMKRYLDSEHVAEPGQSPTSKGPPRLARCQYDVIGSDKIPEYHESVIDIEQKTRVKHEVVGKEKQASLTLWEFEHLVNACKKSEMFQKALAEFSLPDGFELVVEPWFVLLLNEKSSMLIEAGHMAVLILVPKTGGTSRDYALPKTQGTEMPTRISTPIHYHSSRSWTHTQERSSESIAWLREVKAIALTERPTQSMCLSTVRVRSMCLNYWRVAHGKT